MQSFLLDIGWGLAAVALVGTAYTLLAAVLVGRFMQNPQRPAHDSPAVTILKPLHQGEPDLARRRGADHLRRT